MRTSPAHVRFLIITAVLVLLVGGSLVAVALNQSRGSNASVRVDRVWSDSVDAPKGMTFYLLDVNASNGRPSSWQLDPSRFMLKSNVSHVYSPADNYSEVALLSSEVVPSGQRVSGNVAFLLPDDEAPSKLSYDDGGVSLQTTDLPAVSGIASRFDPSVHVQFNGTTAASAVATWDGITNQTNGLTFFGEEPGYRNYSFVFFTGQKIYVTFALYYYKFPYDPNSISVDSVTSDDGYAVSDVVGWQAALGVVEPHQLPVTMTGYGSNVEVTVLVTVPPGPQPGVLHFTLQFSS
jgi:hypothetical protein